MARAILIIGEPGTGKSRSIKGLDPKVTVILKPNSKDLPFRGATKNYKPGMNSHLVQTFKGVGDLLDKFNKVPFVKNIIIEDLTHYISKRVMDESADKGYDKWTLLAKHLKQYIIDKESILRPDLNIFVIGHVSAGTDAAGNSVIGIQTAGKLMDNVIKIPSYFTYVFHTITSMGTNGMEYKFLTNKDGLREAKTPEEMFPRLIDNDMQLIIDGVVKYQTEEGIKPIGTELADLPKVEAKAETVLEEAKPVEETKTEPVVETAPEAEKAVEETPAPANQ